MKLQEDDTFHLCLRVTSAMRFLGGSYWTCPAKYIIVICRGRGLDPIASIIKISGTSEARHTSETS